MHLENGKKTDRRTNRHTHTQTNLNTVHSTYICLNVPVLERLISLGNIPNSNQIDREMCQKISAKVSTFSFKCDLE